MSLKTGDPETMKADSQHFWALFVNALQRSRDLSDADLHYAAVEMTNSYLGEAQHREQTLIQMYAERHERIVELEATLRSVDFWLAQIETGTIDESVGLDANRAAHARNIIRRAIA